MRSVWLSKLRFKHVKTLKKGKDSRKLNLKGIMIRRRSLKSIKKMLLLRRKLIF